MAFDLLLARLRTVKQAKRGDLTDAVIAGAKQLQNYLLHPAAKFERTRSMQILRVLASATVDSETPVLGETLTVVLNNAANEQSKNTLSHYIAFIKETTYVAADLTRSVRRGSDSLLLADLALVPASSQASARLSLWPFSLSTSFRARRSTRPAEASSPPRSRPLRRCSSRSQPLSAVSSRPSSRSAPPTRSGS